MSSLLWMNRYLSLHRYIKLYIDRPVYSFILSNNASSNYISTGVRGTIFPWTPRCGQSFLVRKKDQGCSNPSCRTPSRSMITIVFGCFYSFVKFYPFDLVRFEPSFFLFWVSGWQKGPRVSKTLVRRSPRRHQRKVFLRVQCKLKLWMCMQRVSIPGKRLQKDKTFWPRLIWLFSLL